MSKGFVQEKDARPVSQGPSKCQPLPFAARKMARSFAATGSEADESQTLFDPPISFRRWNAASLESESKMALHGHVVPEGAVLEYQGDASLEGRDADGAVTRHHPPVDHNPPLVRCF